MDNTREGQRVKTIDDTLWLAEVIETEIGGMECIEAMEDGAQVGLSGEEIVLFTKPTDEEPDGGVYSIRVDKVTGDEADVARDLARGLAEQRKLDAEDAARGEHQ